MQRCPTDNSRLIEPEVCRELKRTRSDRQQPAGPAGAASDRHTHHSEDRSDDEIRQPHARETRPGERPSAKTPIATTMTTTTVRRTRGLTTGSDSPLAAQSTSVGAQPSPRSAQILPIADYRQPTRAARAPAVVAHRVGSRHSRSLLDLEHGATSTHTDILHAPRDPDERVQQHVRSSPSGQPRTMTFHRAPQTLRPRRQRSQQPRLSRRGSSHDEWW
jgi:hypothetical protein